MTTTIVDLVEGWDELLWYIEAQQWLKTEYLFLLKCRQIQHIHSKTGAIEEKLGN